jgi:mannose-6-phosphate isomerase-like protein (cupin superfamily)
MPIDQRLQLPLEPPGEKVTVVTSAADSDGALLEVEAEWASAGHKPLAHYHPLQDEHFEILEGELGVRMNDAVRVLQAGDKLDVPHGTVHAMWNSGPTPTRATWQVRPAMRTEQFFAAVHKMRAAGHAGKDGMITLPAAGLVFQAFPDEFRLAIPAIVRRPLTAVLATVGRALRYPRVAAA